MLHRHWLADAAAFEHRMHRVAELRLTSTSHASGDSVEADTAAPLPVATSAPPRRSPRALPAARHAGAAVVPRSCSGTFRTARQPARRARAARGFRRNRGRNPAPLAAHDHSPADHDVRHHRHAVAQQALDHRIERRAVRVDVRARLRQIAPGKATRRGQWRRDARRSARRRAGRFLVLAFLRVAPSRLIAEADHAP